MTKRTIITIGIAVLAALIIGMVWFVFFHSAGTTPGSQTGAFGTSTDRTVGGNLGSGSQSNIPNTVQTGSAPSGTTAGQGGGTGPGLAPISIAITTSTSPVTGASWLSGGGSAGNVGGGSGTDFNPTEINQLNGGDVGGSVNVLGTFGTQGTGGGSNNNLGLAIGAIAGVAAGCLIFMAPSPGSLIPSIPPAVNIQNNQDNNKSFLDCIARTIARAAIIQVTNSVVNWINSGFNGQPSFVQNFNQFFANVADQAAGTFIANVANFAPFCTPFAKQVQVALAQSYAKRNTLAPSCTLSKLIGVNIFSGQGAQGWGGLLAMTSNPSNNPFTAYIAAQAGLAAAQSAALANANRTVSQNGFISTTQQTGCTVVSNPPYPTPSKSVTPIGTSGGTAQYRVCNVSVTTPGDVIENQLNNTLKTNLDSLNLAKSFDEILSALITQLMTKALYGGVSNLSGQTGYAGYYLTPDQQEAQTDGQQLLTTLQQLTGIAQQYGQAKQGDIQDIENAQTQLNSLANCWQAAASSTDDVQKQNIATNDAASALTQLHSYDAQVASLNDDITKANADVALLQDLQTQTLNIGSTADVQAIQSKLDAANAAGQILGPNDVTQAQQDRATLQSQLSTANSGTASNLQLCYAFH